MVLCQLFYGATDGNNEIIRFDQNTIKTSSLYHLCIKNRVYGGLSHKI